MNESYDTTTPEAKRQVIEAYREAVKSEAGLSFKAFCDRLGLSDGYQRFSSLSEASGKRLKPSLSFVNSSQAWNPLSRSATRISAKATLRYEASTLLIFPSNRKSSQPQQGRSLMNRKPLKSRPARPLSRPMATTEPGARTTSP